MSDHGLDIDAISVDQHVLEQDIEQQANEQILQNELELEQKRLDKVRKQIEATTSRIALLDDKVNDPHVKISLKEKYRDDIFKIQQTTLKALREDEQQIEQRMTGKASKGATGAGVSTKDGKRQDESQHDFLVRTGKITPFEKPQSIAEGQVLDEDEEVSVERLKLKRHLSDSDDETVDEAFDDPKLDDGDITVFNSRYSRWAAKRRRLAPDQPDTPAQCLPHPKDQVLSDNLIIPGDVWSGLFPHQKTGVRWLGELYSQHAGGIVGDEMGLGKTIQVAAFLAGLHRSNLLKRPALIVAPATVLEQWVSELHQWWPGLRVAILHSIGTALGGRGSLPENIMDEENDVDYDESGAGIGQSQTMAKNLISSVFESGGIIVTTYAGLKIYSKYLIPKLWSYCVLDEGHKIRNPNSDISLATKQIKTHNRIILSGTPIQNNLTELWSLFDFVFPGKLGTLPVFQNQFSVPINIGGYANATNVQVQTAYKCAVVLRDLISPYLLRRMKTDVATDLPQKSEKVLFCRLTRPQKEAYENFLQSEELKSIMNGKRQVLYGVDILRKVCNHPDLVNRNLKRDDYGNPARSGKMQVVKVLLELWKSEGHKTLLFTQSRQMLDILESFVEDLGLSYLRMDGTTAISHRQKLVDKFNNNQAYDVFLLTTKVGGLGVNLTGASRVIIFDPDWNPSTDMQARERSWRLGQKKQVVIYRLMIAGAIEEKIYHRQIFKQFLTNKILQDPKQKRFFKNSDLHDLFSLSDGTDTDSLFGSSDRVKTELESTVEGVQKQDDFKSEDDQKGKQENGLLQSLFAKANVHSTVEHDAIIESSRPDTVLMEREATRVANEAAEALKNSRKRARKAKIGTPTWTGRFGTAGKDSSQRSSTSILSGLREKRQLETKNEVTVQSTSSLSGTQQSAVDQLKEITEFIQRQPEHTTMSADVVKACKIKLDDDQSVANLRRMLHSVAIWDRDAKTWTLKPDFVA